MSEAVRAGAAAFALMALAALALPRLFVEPPRELALDTLLAATAGPPSGEVVVVAIDAASLAAQGPWPWPRARLAATLRDIAAARPAAVAVDIVLSGPDRAGLDSDAALADAIAAVPAALAAALTEGPGAADAPPQHHAVAPVALTPILLSGPALTAAPWLAAGVETPFPPLAAAAAGIGVAALRGEAGGRVRRAPLIVLADGGPVPGLGVEAVRLAQGAAALRVSGATQTLAAGGITAPLGPAADLRIRPTRPQDWPARTVSVGAPDAVPPLAGRIVVLGVTAAEAAGLRPTAVTPLAPSAQIQADAIETLLSGRPLQRPAAAGLTEFAAAAALAAAASVAAGLASPVGSLAMAAILALGWTGAASTAWLWAGWAIDPVAPAVAALGAGLAATVAAARAARARAGTLRRRFEGHLAPAVVARIAADPGLARLPGERRVVTALFTDIEGFSEASARLAPDALVALLDRYFSGLTAIIHAHGGMVDKFVGDAVHALFNAPLDLADHAARAADCALALEAYGRAFAAAPSNAGFGLTRIGFESGPVVVGDVGSAAKLDYTAHGAAMRIAARLEQACKGLGVYVLAGPGARAAAPDRPWRSFGVIDLKGVGPLPVWAPAPDAAPPP